MTSIWQDFLELIFSKLTMLLETRQQCSIQNNNILFETTYNHVPHMFLKSHRFARSAKRFIDNNPIYKSFKWLFVSSLFFSTLLILFCFYINTCDSLFDFIQSSRNSRTSFSSLLTSYQWFYRLSLI